MFIQTITPLAISDVKLITLKRVHDERGYFAEVMRQDQLSQEPELAALATKPFVQANESASVAGVARGLHTQSGPNLDKLLRVVRGRIIDFAVDIRPNSPHFGQVVAQELAYDQSAELEHLMFIPFGFAHGFIALTDCQVSYFQTGYWSQTGEATLQFTDPDLNWELVASELRQTAQTQLAQANLSPKDAAGLTLNQWRHHPRIVDYS